MRRVSPDRVTFEGRVISGKGEGGKFVTLPWASSQFREKLGVDPFPGTLNLVIDDNVAELVRERMTSAPCVAIEPPAGAGCRGLTLPAILKGRIRAFAVLPEIEDYYPDVLELISSQRLRDSLSLSDGSTVSVTVGLAVPPPRKIRGLILDMDGTLINTFDAFFMSIRASLVSQGMKAPAAEQVKELLDSGHTLIEILRILAPGARWDDGRMTEDFLASIRKEFRGSKAKDVTRLPRTLEALDLFRQSGRVAKMAIATGSTAPRDTIDEDLRKFGLRDYFTCVTIGSDVTRHKPHPELIHACADRIGLPAESCLVIGDATMDVEAGKRAGCMTAAVLTGVGTSDGVRNASADFVEPDLYALAEKLILEGWI